MNPNHPAQATIDPDQTLCELHIKAYQVDYPFKLFDDRHLPKDYTGVIYIWDIDKTYLDTNFSTFKGLARIPLELAIDKTAIEGIPQILRDLRRGPTPAVYGCHPIYFLSASPIKMRTIFEKKMLLDGVEYDGMMLKDWIAIIRSRKWRRLTHQIGYKLCALLSMKLAHPLASEVLFGDDVESDPDVYDLFAGLINQRLPIWDLEAQLTNLDVPTDDQQQIYCCYERLPRELAPVKSAFIRQTKPTPPKVCTKPDQAIIKPYRDHMDLRHLLARDGLI